MHLQYFISLLLLPLAAFASPIPSQNPAENALTSTGASTSASAPFAEFHDLVSRGSPKASGSGSLGKAGEDTPEIRPPSPEPEDQLRGHYFTNPIWNVKGATRKGSFRQPDEHHFYDPIHKFQP